MAKGGKGKLRAAFAQHTARAQQRAAEKERAEAAEAAARKKTMRARHDQRKAQPRLKVQEPFEKDDTVLLVGEGNFSFARSLLSPPRSHAPHLVLATSYDTEEECYRKYPDARENVAEIRRIAGAYADRVVAFGVDAGALDKCALVKQGSWSKVWFGFPHVGAGHKDERRNVLANQLLLLRFFVSVAAVLTRGPPPRHMAKKKAAGSDDDSADERDEDDEDAGVPSFYMPPRRQGSVLVTLRNASPYTLWDITTLAKRLDTVLPAIAASAPALPRGQKAPSAEDAARCGRYIVWRSFEFDPDAWPGQEHEQQ
ncbi:25S rRNA (uracil(2634)-N(3))-methyltransferase [Malassezia cuniculi]|uniref:25S rRNA (Uracil(2634)-N(3))-methyltransferase n=1 Tax=Malassezia cuniculi TaxID=948313 RepID=A0AAF0JCZ3_9BASI|nr:25S rRNA (uracil(2634)-N(3))-methyltransferase [Malassezia cuniculi]